MPGSSIERWTQPPPSREPCLRLADPAPLALVVDDERLILRCVARILRGRLGVEAVTAWNGREALALLSRTGLRPDLVITDLHMAELDGAGLIAALRERDALAAVPVIVMSASDEPCPGAARQLLKPFGCDQLVQAAAALLPAGLARARGPAPAASAPGGRGAR